MGTGRGFSAMTWLGGGEGRRGMESQLTSEMNPPLIFPMLTRERQLNSCTEAEEAERIFVC